MPAERKIFRLIIYNESMEKKLFIVGNVGRIFCFKKDKKI